MKNKRILIFALAFVFGLLVLLYPEVSSAVLMSRGAAITEKFDAAVAAGEDSDALDEAVTYNTTLRSAEMNDLFAAYDNAADEKYLSLADPLGNGMMAAVEIPSLSTTLPVFHHNVNGEDASGLAHIAGSALPVGGTNTHCVVSSHSGSAVRRIVDHAVSLSAGDHIYVHSLSGILCYEVDEFITVSPSELDALSVTQGMDRFTIVMPNGSSRLLVRTCRMAFDPAVYAAERAAGRSPVYSSALGKAIVAAVAVLATFAAVTYLPRLKAGKSAVEETAPKKEEKPKKPRKALSKKKKYLLLLVGFLIGASVYLYPRISNVHNSYQNKKLIESYREKISALSTDYNSSYMDAARKYNASHTVNTIVDAFSHSGSSEAPLSEEYLALLDPAGNGVMGYVEIPKISVQLPIYHGTGRKALDHGVGHLEWTSLPVGGRNTHCVLSGHRGLPTAKLFTDLDRLEVGDDVYIIVLGETLRYSVDEINVVLPDSDEAMEALAIVPGEDLVTLVTCTPYGVNTHRLLVRAHRVETAAAETVHIESAVIEPHNERLYVIAVLAVLVVVSIPVIIVKKKREQK